MNKIIQKLIAWAEKESTIRALILEGSRGNKNFVGELSDYDINVFVDDIHKHTLDYKWLNTFDEVLVYQKEHFYYQEISMPTCLVYFKNIPRIDFSIWPSHILKTMNEENVHEPYKNGYQILIDKDGLTRSIPEPTGEAFKIRKPRQDDYLDAVYNFWFETLAVIKHLKSGHLWFVKTIVDGPIKRYLLQMILWDESSGADWNRNDIHLSGKNLEQKVSKKTLDKIPFCFSPYHKGKTWLSLLRMIDLFKMLSINVASALNYPYPEERLKSIEKYIHRTHNGK